MNRYQILNNSWRSALQIPDRRFVTDWLHQHWVLPPSYAQPGPFDVGGSRHLIAPFAAFQSDHVRQIDCMAAIQTGKTLIVEGCIPWALCNSPGPIMWTFQTDDDAKAHCNERFMEALKSVKQVRDMLPLNRHHTSTTSIYFGGFFLEVNGANINSLQRVSIRYKFNSECWLWKAGLMSHAKGRVSAFEKSGNSKIFNESQGGTDGDDFTIEWNSGSKQVWSIRCFGCGKLQPLVFAAPFQGDSKKFAGVVWDQSARRPDGTWNVGRAAETARWKCPGCSHDHADTATTRAKWNEAGEYSAPVDGSHQSHVSFRWEALVARPMSLLVQQFLTARASQKSGVNQLIQDFQRQRRALPWKDGQEDEVTVELTRSGYVMGTETPGAMFRFMTIDRQRDHFWYVIRDWFSDASSKLVVWGRAETSDMLRDIQDKYKVESQLVFEDAGYFPTAVYTDCVSHGWVALKGSGENVFKVEVKKKEVRRLWSNITRVLHEGKQVPLIHWSSDPIKDILFNLRSGRGVRWEYPDDVGEEYHNQLKGDHKVQKANAKTNRPEWRWVRRHANHVHDCEAMQVAAALMVGVLRSVTPAEEERSSAAGGST